MSAPRKVKFRGLSAVLFAGAVVGITTYAYAVTFREATTKAVIQALVLPTLMIQKYSDLNFHSARPGAKAEIISARSGGGAGGVKVVGYPNQAYTVSFPKGVHLTRGDNPGSVKISDFTSYPDIGMGLLGTEGQLENKVGATRNDIAVDLPSGYYEGNYTLTVAFP